MRARTIDHDQVRALHAENLTVPQIKARVGGSPAYLRLIIKGKVGIKPTNISRQSALSLAGRPARIPAFDTPAIVEGRTVYRSTVVDPGSYAFDVLKSGFNSSKIGKVVTKGRWKGFPIYTLTLEERATCPLSCRHWRSCYGNSMQHAHRLARGAALEARLEQEVRALGRRHRRGFVVRLHVLGDFYSVAYVALWQRLLAEVPQLHVFGFSARWDAERDPIAAALVRLVLAKWIRFAIRFSDAPIDECSTVSVETPLQAPAEAIVCPQQLGRTEACATCGLCWQSKRPVAFITH
ncbi:hypothetical protein HAP47_0022935 [Bradyrhizobium sp. 41S5]|uniref:GP88 family protein n=1 Tax=Bradyrhizobium sp. 41S5 TaxID=1404443 RepID=UPI00156B96CB|nr:hypothetical protein [Bradyrhizobium sp. 41S5]UFX42118.1 hypothetical protein HAP47_0022935 [Bradyrhizobium sp. 41S5]